MEVKSLFEIINDEVKENQDIVGNGILNENSLLLIVGRPKSGKSFLAMNFGLAISSGIDFAGFNIKKAEKVLLLSAEAGYLKNTSSTDFNKAHILCEIHDFSDHPNIGSDLIKRFNKTHRIEIIKQEKRQFQKYGAFGTLSENQMINLLDEHRPKSNYWIFFEPILVR